MLEKINIKYLLLFSLFLMLIQIFIGTDVREFIDEQVKFFGRENKDLWLSSPKLNFYVHRTFSILVFSVNAVLFFVSKNLKIDMKYINMTMGNNTDESDIHMNNVVFKESKDNSTNKDVKSEEDTNDNVLEEGENDITFAKHVMKRLGEKIGNNGELLDFVSGLDYLYYNQKVQEAANKGYDLKASLCTLASKRKKTNQL